MAFNLVAITRNLKITWRSPFGSSSAIFSVSTFVAPPCLLYFLLFLAAEKCQAFTKEMAAFKTQDQEADTTDSEDDDTAEKSAMDKLEGGDSAQAVLVLDALKQNFAMLWAQDLSAEFDEIHDSGAVKATGNDAKSKGKSKDREG